MRTHGRLLARAAACVVGFALLCVASSAGAVEKEHHVGLTLGPSMLVVDGRDAVSSGGGAGVTYSYGWSDAFNIIAEGGASLVDRGDVFSKTAHNRPSSITSAAIGAAYVLDVLRYVPYAGLLAGGYVLGGGNLDKPTVLPGAQIALGLDYKFNFTWSAGVGYRQHLLFTKMSDYPSYSTFFLRVEYAWGR